MCTVYVEENVISARCDDSTLHCTAVTTHCGHSCHYTTVVLVYWSAMLVLVLVSPLLLAALATASTLHVVDIQPEPTAVRMAVLACQGLINRQVPRDRTSIKYNQLHGGNHCYRRGVRRRCSH